MALDPEDQKLITVMANRILNLTAIAAGLSRLMLNKGMCTEEELKAAVQSEFRKQKDTLLRSQKSSEDTMEEFLRGFEGPKQ
jgi:hypothetical protein